MYKFKIPNNIELIINKQAIKIKGPYSTILKQKSKNLKLYKFNNYIYCLNNEDFFYFNILKNIILGVSKGYSCKLKIIGVEYKVNLDQNTLIFRLGFSHEIYYKIPSTIKIYNPKPNLLVITGYDKNLVTQVSAEIRNLKLPEPYKGKGIRYFDEILKQKEGKKN